MRSLPILLPALLGSLSPAAAQQDPAALLAEARARLAPDRRTAVFDVVPELSGGKLTLRGEVHSAELKQHLLALLAEAGGFELVDEVQALPDPGLGDRTVGVVSVSVANLRSEPGHAAELGTQALLGTPLRVLKQKGDWYYVQTPNRYLCWTQDRVTRMTGPQYEEWTARPKVIVTATFAEVGDPAEPDGPPVGDVVAGCILATTGTAGDRFRVLYPDGRSGLLLRRAAEALPSWLAKAAATPERIVATARRFRGVPYLWGGTSTKGMDCSGFTHTVYFLNGTLLPRDADQQLRVGEPVATDDLGQLRPGDLLFFGRAATVSQKERVQHVAISLGGPRFIHASVDVHVNSLDPGDPDYSPSLRKSLLGARRILGAKPETGVEQLAQLPYYCGHGR